MKSMKVGDVQVNVWPSLQWLGAYEASLVGRGRIERFDVNAADEDDALLLAAARVQHAAAACGILTQGK